jgi:hypothetical protein
VFSSRVIFAVSGNGSCKPSCGSSSKTTRMWMN